MRSIGRRSMFLMPKVTAHQAHIKYSVFNLVMFDPAPFHMLAEVDWRNGNGHLIAP